MSRLLILGCSATKTHSPFRVPTYERYDGPIWRSFRAVRDQISGDVSAVVLSAEHGLIPLHSCIHDYERVMTPERAAELRDGTAARALKGAAALHANVNCYLKNYVLGWGFDEALIVLGATYLEAIDLSLFASAGVPVRIAAGGIGVKRSTMKRWLTGEIAAWPEAAAA